MIKIFLEVLGRFINALTTTILLVIGEPHIGATFPILAPYSIHIIYTGIIILCLWMTLPWLDGVYGYYHTHEK